jgi:hypothetical protein
LTNIKFNLQNTIMLNNSIDEDSIRADKNIYGPPEKPMLKVMIPVSTIWGWFKRRFKQKNKEKRS